MFLVYYGDEIARSLVIEGTEGDATLRSVMDWKNLNPDVLTHWQVLGRFRNKHKSVGAGEHFSLEHKGEGTLAARFYNKNNQEDIVLIGVGLPNGLLEIEVKKVFYKSPRLCNAYTIKNLLW